MKKRHLLSTYLILLLSIVTYAQNSPEFFKVPLQPADDQPTWVQKMYESNPNVRQVDALFQQYHRDNQFIKTIHVQNYKYWRRNVETYINELGYIEIPTKQEKLQKEQLFRTKRAESAQKSATEWTNIGPYETYKDGTLMPISHQANVYCIDQSKSNADVLFCGTESGGAYLSTDRGLTWTLMTAGEDYSTVDAVAIHPTNPSRLYVGANSRVYESLDSGNSWTEILFAGGRIYEIKFMPNTTSVVFAVGENGLFRSSNTGSTWTTIYTERCWDIDFHPTDANRVYLLKSNTTTTTTEFYLSTNAGNTFTIQTNGWYIPEDAASASENGGKIAVTAAAPDRVYACLIGASKADDSGWIGLYRSENGGAKWALPAGQIGGPYNAPNTMPWNVAAYSDGYHQGFYNFDCEASQTNADQVWIGTIRLSETLDGGATFSSIGAANSTKLSDVHADIQSIHVNGSEVWVASDGGINYSNDELDSHESRKYGITASDFWGFGHGWNEDVYVGGKYHNGNTAYYGNYGVGLVHHEGGVEESTGYVNPFLERTAYFNRYWAGGVSVSKRLASSLGGSITNLPSLSVIPNENYTVCSSSAFYNDPRYANHMYAGVGTALMKSTDGINFEELYNFGTEGAVHELQISRQNPDIIYAVFQNGGYWDWCEIHRSTDGGQTFTQLTAVPTNNRWRLQISLNPMDDNELWVAAVNGNDGQKVYRTTDAGNNWMNMTDATLNGDAPRDIHYHGGSGGYVYLATNYGVYYYNPNTGTWNDYSEGLPFRLNANKMFVFYKDNKLRLSTYGRGVFEADLPAPTQAPIAQAMTLTDTLRCSNDTIEFDSYSIVNQDGATWQWNVSPAPEYISDPTSRNPKVLLSDNGSYEVSLTVTQANGSTDTYTNPQFIVVNNECRMDTLPGKAMKIVNSGDYAQTDNLNFTATEMTITAWINIDGIQPDYSGIVMNDADAVGLNFREGNNTLAYHWPGGQWWWDSNIIVPQNEWVYVAMSATPNGITIYMNDESATHVTSPSPTLIETMKIGSYKGWDSRNMTGLIDEVTIWNRALSQDEIRELRHLTRDKIANTDTGLIAYYQFNSTGTSIFDKINSNNATLSGNASKVTSTAPVGSGVSQRLTVNSGGIYEFVDAGAQIEFNTSPYPNEEIVVSRLNIRPHNPNTDSPLSGYWIINNYGQATNPLSIGFNSPDSNPGFVATNQASLFSLHTRPEHDDQAWTDLCTMQGASGIDDTAYYLFSTGCDLSGTGQFDITQSCPDILVINAADNIGNPDDVRSSISITASNAIPQNYQIIYQSGTIICLEPGFEVSNMADFEAFIGGCED